MTKATAQLLSEKQQSRKELFSLEITEKTTLTSGRERVSRDQFFPYFPVQESLYPGVMVAVSKQIKGGGTVHKM